MMHKKLQPRFVAWALIVLTGALLLVRFPGQISSGKNVAPSAFSNMVQVATSAKAGGNPYVVPEGKEPFRYSPGTLALAGTLPSDPGRAWFWFSAFCILGMAVLLGVAAHYPSWKSVGLLALGIGLAWKGILETLDSGQLELFVFVIAVAAAAMLVRLPFLAGLLAGFLPWVKLPWLALFFPLTLGLALRVEKRSRLFVSGYLFSWFIWGAAVPSLTFGQERAKLLSQSWVGMLESRPVSFFLSDSNQSVWVSAMRWAEAPLVALGFAGLGAGFFLARLMTKSTRIRVNHGVALAWISPWLVFGQLLNPLAWRWGSVFLLGAPLALIQGPLARAEEERRETDALHGAGSWILGGLIFILWLMQLNPVVRALGFHHWSDLHSSGIVTAYWLACLALTLR
jgi:hypothetical protein